MLNRKLSEYLFYAVLVSILLAVFVVRSITLGNINSRIETVTNENIILNKQINTIEALVEENKDLQSDHLYDLYNRIPSYYSYNELYFNLLAKLYETGVDDTDDFNANITIAGDINTGSIATYSQLSDNYDMVFINVSFNTDSVEMIKIFIDELYHSDQIYIVNTIEYSTPEPGEPVSVNISMYSFYATN